MNKLVVLLKVLMIFLCSASCFVSANAQIVYKLVTSNSDIQEGGKYIIATSANGRGKLMKKYVSYDRNCRALDVQIQNGVIKNYSGAQELFLRKGQTEGFWAFQDVNTDKYLSRTQLVDLLKIEQSKIYFDCLFSINFSSQGEANMVFKFTDSKKDKRFTIGYYPGGDYFSCFQFWPQANFNFTPVYLYKACDKYQDISSISVSGTPSLTFYCEGQSPNYLGLTVTATFKDNTTEDITDLVKWTFSTDTINLSTKELTFTANFKGLSARKTIPISVHRRCYTNLYFDVLPNVSADAENMRWDAIVSDVVLNKGTSSMNANAFCDSIIKRKETHVYEGQKLIFTPKANLVKIFMQVFQYNNMTPVDKAVLQENVVNADFSWRSHLSDTIEMRRYKFITLIPKDKSKPVEVTLTGNMALIFVRHFYQPDSAAIGQAGYSTCCLSYDAKIPAGMTVYGVKDDGHKVTLIERGDSMIASNEGVVLHGAQGKYEFLAADKKAEKIATNEMVGVLKDTPLTSADNAYLLTRRKNDGNVAFRLLSSNYTLAARRAYLKSKVLNHSRVLLSVYDAVETGIETIEEEDSTVEENAPIYNLAGQRMSRMHKGINIVKGKLVIR